MFAFCANCSFAQNKMLMASAQGNNDEMRAKSIDFVETTNNQNAEAEKMKNNEFCRSLYKVATEFPQDFTYLKGEKNLYGEWKSKVVNSSMSNICITQNKEKEYSWQGNVSTQSDWQKANVAFQKITQTLRSCAVVKDFKPEENVSMTQNAEVKNKEGANILHTWTVVEPIETPYLGMQIASELKFKEGKWGVMVSIKKVKTF
jgi:hypothetical protein